MLLSIQKKLENTACPSCGKDHVLQATLHCSRDEKQCKPICQCTNCGLVLNVDIPSSVSQINDNDSVSLSCDLETSACYVEVLKVA